MTRAQVQTLQYRYNQGRKQLMPMAGENTNDLGEYRISVSRPGVISCRPYITIA